MWAPPPTSTSCPPDVIHVIGIHRPSLFFVALLLPLLCIILNGNRDIRTLMKQLPILPQDKAIRSVLWFVILRMSALKEMNT